MESALARAIRMVVEEVIGEKHLEQQSTEDETRLRKLLGEVVGCARIEERNSVINYEMKHGHDLDREEIFGAIAEGAHV